MNVNANNRGCAFPGKDAPQSNFATTATAEPTTAASDPSDREAEDFDPFGLARKKRGGRRSSSAQSRARLPFPSSALANAEEGGTTVAPFPPPRSALDSARFRGPGAVRVRGPSEGRGRDLDDDVPPRPPPIVFTSATAVAVEPEDDEAEAGGVKTGEATSDACCSVACPCDAGMSCVALLPCCEVRVPSFACWRRRVHANALVVVLIIVAAATVLGVIFARPRSDVANAPGTKEGLSGLEMTPETESVQPRVTNTPTEKYLMLSSIATNDPSFSHTPQSFESSAVVTQITPSLGGAPTLHPSETPTVPPTIELGDFDLCDTGKIFADDQTTEAWFGGSLAISGDTAVVGAELDSVNGNFSGSAYVFVRSDSAWSQQAKLVPHDGSTLDFFGWDVDVAQNTAIIAARKDGGERGSAYIFFRGASGWTQHAKLLAEDGTEGDKVFSIISMERCT